MGSPLNFYDILEIPKNASPEDIRNAYKTLAKKWHPDKHPPSSKPDAEARFKAITQAYVALHNICESGGSRKPEKKQREDSVPKHATATPGRRFRDFDNPKRASADFKDFAYKSTAATPYYYARTPGRDCKDTYFYPKGTAEVTAQGSGAVPRPRSFSGQLRKKPPPEERKLECTLEELCRGCVKKISFTRDVVGKNGVIVQKQETETIRVKPGWKKGTKITFEGMGNERPGHLPADLVFFIVEKEHPVFRRVGNDLVLKVEIPLVNALIGWTLSIRHLTGEKMTCSFHDEIIYPGYEKVVEGQGMPVANEMGKKGDLRIKISVTFPTQLSSEQKSGLVEILKDTTARS